MDKDNQMSLLNQVPKTDIVKLKNIKVYFGHQSIGYEIVQGIININKIIPQLELKIIESRDKSHFTKFNIIHSSVGSNFDPKSKIDDYAKIIKSGIGNSANYAFFKLCYVDMDENSDVTEIFNHYKEVMNGLESKYAKTVFIHFTMPIISKELPFIRHIKNIINSVLGRYVTSSKLNSKRQQYNELMRKEYKNSGRLFDLAAIESTKPDGYLLHYNDKSNLYDVMYQGYTYDGGHLNEHGRNLVAENLLIFLINQVK